LEEAISVAADRISAPIGLAADLRSRVPRRVQVFAANTRFRITAVQTELPAAGRHHQIERLLSAGKRPTATAAQT
jgi:hypothetical protein